MSLELVTYTGGLTWPKKISIFNNWIAACAHLCDHVLTMPEGGAWAEILGPEAATVILSNAGFRLAKAIWNKGNKGEEAQDLYEAYSSTLCAAMDSAAKTGWHWTDRWNTRIRKAFGVSGVLVLFDTREVRSGMLPGWGNSLHTSRAKNIVSVEQRRRNPLPRQGANDIESNPCTKKSWGMRRWPIRYDPKTRPAPQTEGLRRYRIFRRCAQSVRAEVLASYYSMKSRVDASSGGSLREAIADYATWTRLASEG
jgi:hypothetical protein